MYKSVSYLLGKRRKERGTLLQPATSLFNWRGEKDFVMMKTLLCLTAIFIAIHAAFPFQKDAALSDTNGNSVYGESTPQEETVRLSYPESNSMSEDSVTSQKDGKKKRRGGSPYCDTTYRPPYNDYISQKFFDDHICVYHVLPPNLDQFCSLFRPTVRLYHVILLTPSEYDDFYNDIANSQDLLYQYRYDFYPEGPTPSTAHFYTYNSYPLFIECEYYEGYWYGTALYNMYQVYVPIGFEGIYQIYHGCRPSVSRPEDGVAPGSC